MVMRNFSVEVYSTRVNIPLPLLFTNTKRIHIANPDSTNPNPETRCNKQHGLDCRRQGFGAYVDSNERQER